MRASLSAAGTNNQFSDDRFCRCNAPMMSMPSADDAPQTAAIQLQGAGNCSCRYLGGIALPTLQQKPRLAPGLC